MARSLYVRLLGAFALVIFVLAVAVAVLVNRATADEFRAYTNRSGQAWAQYLAPALAGYYEQYYSWDGVDDLLHNPQAADGSRSGAETTVTTNPSLPPISPEAEPTAVSGMGRGMGRGMGMGPSSIETAIPVSPNPQNPGEAESSLPNPMRGGMGSGMRGRQGLDTPVDMDVWSMMGHRIVVADAAGRVVSDSSGTPSGEYLPSEVLASGLPIQVEGQPAGTLLVGSGAAPPGTPAGDFLSALNRSILLAVLAAGLVALVLGSLLFFQITAPIRSLTAAAGAIASGDLNYRVPVRSRDELGGLAKTFNDMADSLRRSENQRRQMVADVAHELRTPLSVMQANLEAMQDGILPLNADEIASLHEETLLLSRLVADLHLLSLAEAGQLSLVKEAVQPGELVRKAAERLSQAAQDRGIALSVETPPALPAVRVDANRISQVLGNLISNALRYTGPDGKITVQVETFARQGSDEKQQSAVVVSVTDTGCGIPEEDLPRIFDRFYRADRSRNRATGGSGLGLAITKYIIEAHGGRAWAESPACQGAPAGSQGTRISFLLPVDA